MLKFIVKFFEFFVNFFSHYFSFFDTKDIGFLCKKTKNQLKILEEIHINHQIIESYSIQEDFLEKVDQIDFSDFQLYLHAEDKESKTEDPTEITRRKAREEGRVFTTKEIANSLSILLPVILLIFFSNFVMKHIIATMKNSFQIATFVASAENVGSYLRQTIVSILTIFVPIGSVVFVFIVLSFLLQTKFNFSIKKLKFNFKQIAPSWKNFVEKTIFSGKQLANFAMILFKLALLGGLVYFFLVGRESFLIQLMLGDVVWSFQKMMLFIFEFMIIIAVLMMLLSLPDWFIQRFFYEKDLKLTKYELKREIKETEGDPLVKQKLKQRIDEILALSKSKEATVMITNPTHYACAIYYNVEEMGSNPPKLVAKGKDNLALEMKKVAKANEVPLVENKELARSIYAKTKVNQEIPEEFYLAIIEIFRSLDLVKV